MVKKSAVKKESSKMTQAKDSTKKDAAKKKTAKRSAKKEVAEKINDHALLLTLLNKKQKMAERSEKHKMAILNEK